MSLLDAFDRNFLNPSDYFGDNRAADILYRDHAQNAPIVDAHTHADDARLASNRPYQTPWELVCKEDHYVYSAMRQAGISERLITGKATRKEKWGAFCKMMETVGANPLNFWIHEGLHKSLEVDEVMKGISSDTADQLWKVINKRLRDPRFSPRGLLKKQGVVFLGTTDDPTSTLKNHGILKQAEDFGVEVVPTFRPDAIVNKLNDKKELEAYLTTLGGVAGKDINSFDSFKNALEQRHGAFVEMGCRSSDHGPDQMPHRGYGNDNRAEFIFDKARDGEKLLPEEIELFTGWLLGYTAQLNAKHQLVTQLHVGGWRNLSDRQFNATGSDTGFDASRHNLDLRGHREFLNWAESSGLFKQGLKVVPYPLNTKDQETMASLARVFAPHVKLGSSWWFIDTEKGMNDQLAIVEGIILSTNTHAGMVSDTRSPITTASRFALFRQSLCLHTGEQLQRGRMLSAQAIRQVEQIAYKNACELFKVSA